MRLFFGWGMTPYLKTPKDGSCVQCIKDTLQFPYKLGFTPMRNKSVSYDRFAWRTTFARGGVLCVRCTVLRCNKEQSMCNT